jgi:ribosomal protein S1
MNTTDIPWETVKETLPIGERLKVRVTRHWPFGVFVEIPNIPFQGLIQITDFRDEGRMTPDQYPAVGSVVEAVVLGFKETGKQIWLGMRPSQLCRSKGRRQE